VSVNESLLLKGKR